MFQLHVILDHSEVNWLDYVVPFGAVVGAAAAMWTVIVAKTIARNQNTLQATLAGNQEKLQERQLRQDLYDRRFKVFKDVGTFMQPVLASPDSWSPHTDEHRRFQETIQEATFLFGTEVREYLDDVHRTAMGVWSSRRRMEKNRGDVQAIEENGAKFQHFSDLWEKRAEVFHREISLA